MTTPARLSPSRVEEMRQRFHERRHLINSAAFCADFDDLLREVDRVSALLRAPEVGELIDSLHYAADKAEVFESTEHAMNRAVEALARTARRAADLLDALRAEGGETT